MKAADQQADRGQAPPRRHASDWLTNPNGAARPVRVWQRLQIDDSAPRRVPLARLFALAFVTGFSGAMMPGPLLVAVIQQTAIQGFHAVIALITGHLLLEVVTVGLLMLGLQAVIARPRVRGAIGLVGGAALVYMGADMMRSAAGLSLNLEAAGGVVYSWPKLMLLGAAVCAANPYFTGWWATVGAGQLAHMAPRTTAEYLSFFLGHEAADYTWYAVVGLLVITGRRWLTDGVYRGLIITCAVILMLIGLRFLFTGFRFVLRPQGQQGPHEPLNP